MRISTKELRQDTEEIIEEMNMIKKEFWCFGSKTI